MKAIKTASEYQTALAKVELLLEKVDNDTPVSDNFFIELDQISNLVADYESEHYPIEAPSLVEVIKLRMFEYDLKQKDLAKLLDTTPSRVSEYLKGKRVLTMDIAKSLYKKLQIDADIILNA